MYKNPLSTAVLVLIEENWLTGLNSIRQITDSLIVKEDFEKLNEYVSLVHSTADRISDTHTMAVLRYTDSAKQRLSAWEPLRLYVRERNVRRGHASIVESIDAMVTNLEVSSANIAFASMLLAKEYHKNQLRKYTNTPYTDHLAEVAGIAATYVSHPLYARSLANIVIAVAWLHDCMEDQGLTTDQLRTDLNSKGCSPYEIDQVVEGVLALSDMETGNRAQRKQLSRERLARAQPWVQTIKCADFISNTASIVQHDPSFAKLYLEEKEATLNVLTRAYAPLRELASQ